MRSNSSRCGREVRIYTVQIFYYHGGGGYKKKGGGDSTVGFHAALILEAPYACIVFISKTESCGGLGLAGGAVVAGGGG